MNKKNRLKKITVPSDCWKKSHFFLRKFSLQKDYSSKWVGEKFPSFFEKISKIRSHSVKKKHFFVTQNHEFHENFDYFFQ